MGICGYVQTKQLEYDFGNALLSWGRSAFYRYLVDDAGLNVYTGEDCEYSDNWEIEISDEERLMTIIKVLRDDPNAVDKYLPDDETRGRGYALDLAAILVAGLRAARSQHSQFIYIDWF